MEPTPVAYPRRLHTARLSAVGWKSQPRAPHVAICSCRRNVSLRVSQWQKDAAVRSERFGEATSVRSAIAAIEDKDGVQGLLRALDDAIKAERRASGRRSSAPRSVVVSRTRIA